MWRRSADNNVLYRDPEYVTSYMKGTSRVVEVQFTYPAFLLDSTAFARDTTCLVAWPGRRYRAFLERDRPVHQQNFFGSLTTGQENSNGLMYMRNRYYNPLTGAFTQTDPIGLAGGLNTYGYAEGNPVTYTDPYGLCAKEQKDRRGPCPGGWDDTRYRQIESYISIPRSWRARGIDEDARRRKNPAQRR